MTEALSQMTIDLRNRSRQKRLTCLDICQHLKSYQTRLLEVSFDMENSEEFVARCSNRIYQS